MSTGDYTQGERNITEIWEPTYRMKPSDNERFMPRQVEAIIKEIMDKKLKKAKFDDQKCKMLALELCTEIKEKVKDLNIPRYKVVLQSVIGEVKGQGAYIASRCLWDTETDNYSSFSMKNVSDTHTHMHAHKQMQQAQRHAASRHHAALPRLPQSPARICSQ